MQYWWVNQNKTYKHEVPGGYMWSPKTNADGSHSHFYTNMTLVEPGDLVYSFCDTYVKAIGLVKSKAVSLGKPTEFAVAGHYWQDDGWFVEVDFQELNIPIRPRDHMDSLLDTLPGKYSPLQPNGNGNQVYLCNVPDAMSAALNTLLDGQVKNYLDGAVIIQSHEDELLSEEKVISDRKDIPETEKLQLIKARRGQGLFRSRVCMIEKACRVTNLDKHGYLRASHIKPWSESTDFEKLDGNNGLMLSPHIDYLFDKGFISFTDDGVLLVSEKLDKNTTELWSIDVEVNVGKFNVDQANYLKYHRDNKFLK